MKQPLNAPLIFFFGKRTMQNGLLVKEDAGQRMIWGCVKPAGTSTKPPQGKAAAAPEAQKARECFDIIIRAERFEDSLQKIIWHDHCLIPLSEPQFVGDRIGYTCIQAALWRKQEHSA
ncbi:hypothetical protein [Candidatus Hepatobacter penaei]|uniref:hypothetical protein n=1 Tax=Candidatus Hepatobacter penaei TaxID=1274402 RepID=UPI0004F2F831|nr:hypothetical protein [Candidatus Hepatobacter penaei]